MHYIRVKTEGVKNKQYVKGINNEYPLLGSWEEAAPFSKPCTVKIKNELEKKLVCGEAVADIIEK